MSRWRRVVSRLLPARYPATGVSRTVGRGLRDRPAGHHPAYDATHDAGTAYAPVADGRPDPGEVVWAWVPFEEDDSRGKDRPVLLVGRRGDRLLGLMLSSRDHDLDAEDEARHGRHWMDIGSGAWDRESRPSEARLDRLLVLAPEAVRREGAVLDRAVFEAVVAAARQFHPLGGPPTGP
jgi:hypothetical protein